MLNISIGCNNDNTYGLSCIKCGECGRKFTMNGVDDSQVIANKLKSYKEFLDSKSWKDINIKINMQ